MRFTEGSSSSYPLIYVIIGGTFSLIFIAIMILFLYGVIEKRCDRWTRKRSSRRRRRKGRKTRNTIRDESTVINFETNIV